MSTDTIIIMVVGIVLVVGGLYFYYYQKDKKAEKKEAEAASQVSSTTQIQLHAYERLVILAERIALPNIISRLNQPGASLRDMQHLLTHAIKEEFDYNLSQQIYVTPQSWEAVRNLKEQNILIINQIAATLPANANGLDLNKRVLEYVMSQPKGSLHTIVQEALSYEAKKIMG
jgi:heme/copper-type cytochrome/quinol oxidase subunit 2